MNFNNCTFSFLLVLVPIHIHIVWFSHRHLCLKRERTNDGAASVALCIETGHQLPGKRTWTGVVVFLFHACGEREIYLLSISLSRSLSLQCNRVRINHCLPYVLNLTPADFWLLFLTPGSSSIHVSLVVEIRCSTVPFLNSSTHLSLTSSILGAMGSENYGWASICLH